MLLAEEQQAHKSHGTSQPSSSSSSNSSVHHSLVQLHQAALHQQALLQHAECAAAPAVAAMQQLAVQTDMQIQQLEAENQRLQVSGGTCSLCLIRQRTLVCTSQQKHYLFTQF